MKYKELIPLVSKTLNLKEEEVTEAYLLFFRFIKDTMKGLPHLSEVDEGTYSSLKTNFNIPRLGKFVTSFSDIQRTKNKYNRFLKIKKGEV